MNLEVAKRLLRVSPGLPVFPPDVAGILDVARRRIYRGGDALMTEGDSAEGLFFLIDGDIKVQRRDVSGTMRELAVVKSPAIVGHMAVIDGSKRSANCVAVGQVVAFELDWQSYNRLIDDLSGPGMALRRLLLSSLSCQLTDGNARLRTVLPNHSGEFGDPEITAEELLEVAGVLEGWKVDTSRLSQVKVVYDEDQLRNVKSTKSI